MNNLEQRVKKAALSSGAAVAGIASRDRMNGFPPSGDPAYLMPSSRSIVSFAVPFDRKMLREFFGKKSWRAFGDAQKKILQTLYGVNDLLVDLLRREGHEALGVQVNGTYRPEEGAQSFLDMTAFVPDFSHQYGAVAAGLGRLGWSGNLLSPRFGAALLLGTVLTSAEMTPDPLCGENPCDRCGLCVQACPVGMMHPKRGVQKTVAGITEEISLKRPHSCCWIGCGDYHGLSRDGKWSNWSPYRIKGALPETREEMDSLMVTLRRADPESGLEPNPYTDYRAVTFDPSWTFTATCGNCANICWKSREDREENMRLIRDGGVVALYADGGRRATREEIVELDTPYDLNVAVPVSEYGKIRASEGKVPPFAGHLDKDKAVQKHLHEAAARWR